MKLVFVMPQCRDWLKRLQSEYWKTRDQNPTLGYSPTLGLFSEEFDCVLGIAPSTEPTMVHDDLVSQGGARLAPESSMGTDGSQEQVPSEGSEETVTETDPTQQQHILGPHLEELFDIPSSPARNSSLRSLQQRETGQKLPRSLLSF
ncbi:hypothetical protein UY3_13484 [Chelonia mydas]|uniref:Uncharacterized protein n=1 Tax=Chelonia mydas TaxID=8469 RepID=M7AVB5_CHEMY|nr:hypothetical protein UY3_13484 [Chelonia mydas]